MSELSLHFCEDAVDIGDDGKLLGRIPTQKVNEKGLELLKRENQLRMGTVPYQDFLAGVVSGVTLLFGPPEPVRIPVDLPPEEMFPPVDGTKVPTTFDGMLPGEPAEGVALASSQRGEASESDERLEAAATENSASPAPTP